MNLAGCQREKLCLNITSWEELPSCESRPTLYYTNPHISSCHPQFASIPRKPTVTSHNRDEP